MAEAGYFYELADTAEQRLWVFRSRDELVDHIERNPLSMFMRVFRIPMKLATDGTAQQGVLNVKVRAGNPEEIPIEELLSEAS